MRETIASIQFLRFVAASLVAQFHSTLAIDKYFSGSLPPSFLNSSVLGSAGVDIFFVISGFIMVYTSFSDKEAPFSAKRFLTRRAIRIYPIYFIYSAFYLYFYHVFATGKNLTLGQFFGSMLLLPGYSADIIGPGWTLSFEIYFYACFAIAMTLGLTRGISILTLFFLAAIAANLVLHATHPVIHVMTSTLLIEFLLGAWIGYAVMSKLRMSNTVATMMILFAAVWFLASFAIMHLPSIIKWGMPSALLISGFVFLEKNDRLPSIIKNWSFLGDSSYSLYLLHIVLIDAVIFLAIYLDDGISAHVQLIGRFGMMTACIAIAAYCVAVAFVLYELVERRVVRRLKSVVQRKLSKEVDQPLELF